MLLSKRSNAELAAAENSTAEHDSAARHTKSSIFRAKAYLRVCLSLCDYIRFIFLTLVQELWLQNLHHKDDKVFVEPVPEEEVDFFSSFHLPIDVLPHGDTPASTRKIAACYPHRAHS
jgi:hypothetical protein